MKTTNLILLLSGGLDSAVLLKMALALDFLPHCVLIDYGQKHVKELQSAILLCKENKVSYQVVTIGGLEVSSKLTDGTEGRYKGVSEWHVPSRNMIFVAIAASIAESNGIPLIWYGANFEDRENQFPDCYQEWVLRMNNVLEINGSTPLTLGAPLLGVDKKRIELFAINYGIDKEKIHSGYGE